MAQSNISIDDIKNLTNTMPRETDLTNNIKQNMMMPQQKTVRIQPPKINQIAAHNIENTPNYTLNKPDLVQQKVPQGILKNSLDQNLQIDIANDISNNMNNTDNTNIELKNINMISLFGYTLPQSTLYLILVIIIIAIAIWYIGTRKDRKKRKKDDDDDENEDEKK